LLEAIDVLKRVEGLAFAYFDDSDVVRHHLVQRIVRAYDEHKVRVGDQQMLLLGESRNSDSIGDRPTGAMEKEEKGSAPSPDASEREK
jgi:hypothetical protein